MGRFQQLLLDHRRTLAALLAGLAVLAGLSSLSRPEDGVPVLVARHDLRSGHVLTPGDVWTRAVPASAVPAHVLDRTAAVGRRIAGPMRAGEPLTDFRVLGADALAGYGDDAVLTTIRVDLADGAAGVRVGDRVDVVAVDPDGESHATIVARDVEVVTVPPPDDPEAAALGVVTREKEALALATAALEARFSVITSS
jgi:Flp pilus assembly protein CpaB